MLNEELMEAFSMADYNTLILFKQVFADDKEVVSAIDEVIKDRNYDDMNLWEE